MFAEKPSTKVSNDTQNDKHSRKTRFRANQIEREREREIEREREERTGQRPLVRFLGPPARAQRRLVRFQGLPAKSRPRLSLKASEVSVLLMTSSVARLKLPLGSEPCMVLIIIYMYCLWWQLKSSYVSSLFNIAYYLGQTYFHTPGLNSFIDQDHLFTESVNTNNLISCMANLSCNN